MLRPCIVCGRAFQPTGPRNRRCSEHELRGREHAGPSTRAQNAEYERNRAIVLKRDAGKPCPLCGQPILAGERVEVDHLVSVARGGSHHLDNLQRTHASCNKRKQAGSHGITAPSASTSETPRPRGLRLPRPGGGS